MTATPHSIVAAGLRFAWPDGSTVFDGLDLAVGPGRTGLIGINGSGKSTLLKLITGELKPAAGSIGVAGRVGYLHQDLTLESNRGADEVLGIAGIRRALDKIERGAGDEADFAVVGDAWDIEERARALLDRLGLGHIALDRTLGQLSGGETILLGLAALLLAEPDVLLLDEPTNNLDLAARRRLYDAVAGWRKVLVIVSHDRELLRLVDQIAELSDGEVRWYGGNLAAYEEAVAVEREAAERAVRSAESDVRRQHRELVEARTKLARRVRYGKKMYENKREPKVVMQARKRAAQVSAGKHRVMHEERLADARAKLTEAAEQVRDDDEIRIDLPETRVPAGRTVLDMAQVRLRHGGTVSLNIRGPERIALLGANGSGKTTLLRTIAGELAPRDGTVRRNTEVGYLPQRLDVLDDERSLLDNLRDRATGRGNPADRATARDNLGDGAAGRDILRDRGGGPSPDNLIRARLARFLFRGERAGRLVGTLSGGERFRATLAALLLAEPPPQLLMLDEPTNNLDMASVRQLTQALESYQGAIIVVSHDLPVLRSIGITRWLRLDPPHGLVDLADEAGDEPPGG